MNAHWLLAAGFAGMAVAIFFLGWASRIMWREWKDDRALRAMEARYERHSHRKGTALVAAHVCSLCGTSWDTPDGKCECSRAYAAEPSWLFAGESSQGWASESAEYELLTQTEPPRCPCCGEPMRRDPHNPYFCWTCGLYAQDGADECDVHGAASTATLPASSVEGEPPIDTGELLAITDRVESWIAQWTAQGNVDRHTIQAGE